MSESAWWLVLALVCLAVAAVLAWRQAVRLDRLHRQVLQARAGLDVLLVRRAWAAMALATSELLDPASAALIASAARDCLDAAPALTADAMQPQRSYTLSDVAETRHSQPRQVCESVLTQVLRHTLSRQVRAELESDAPGRALVAELWQANQRVAYARRFHNDHVARTRKLRAGVLARSLRLAGRAPWPETIDIDDTLTSVGEGA
ncbi:hypothetical protein H8R18_04140 [Nanchangia anserum]|uniref:LemA family protein n=1 Tax=Nanchangia anserum TaxID=2692125 RepID=A0A8I0KQS9_9ACTO|nr:hypothetical protein [Nanchangia anserum]MBD3688747.1 hypothetical protein [Nanchangia anserum]QOX82489.1 hypothetical protein H8R18_04140 [Nanchangia anserum]